MYQLKITLLWQWIIILLRYTHTFIFGDSNTLSKLTGSHFKTKYYQVYDFQKVLGIFSTLIPGQNPHLLQIKVFSIESWSFVIFTLEDKQIVCTDKLSQTAKLSDVKTGQTNLNLLVWLSICEDNFLKIICPSRQTGQPQFNLNSHSDGLRRTNGQFARLGGMELAEG